MIKNYFYTIFIVLLFTSFGVSAQGDKNRQDDSIEGFRFYPNPVTNSKLYITSTADKPKEIEIFNLLGRLVLQTILHEKELNVSNLSPGVYIIKVREEEATITRKLVIK